MKPGGKGHPSPAAGLCRFLCCLLLTSRQGETMTAAIVLSASVLSVLLVTVLAREIRRRRATQVLASRILKRWRTPDEEVLAASRPLDGPRPGDDGLRRRS